MSPRHMELFMAVMTSRTFLEAAERLQISAPAVTKAVRALETESGLQLFERRHAKVTPTSAALRLFPHVQKALGEFRAAQRIARHLRDEDAGHVSVAATTTSLDLLLPDALAAMRARWPSATFEVFTEAGPSGVLDFVDHGEVDIGISQQPSRKFDPRRDRCIESRELCAHPLAVLFPRDHALARRAVVRPTDLEGERLIRARTELSTLDLIDAAFRADGVSPRMGAEASTSYAICALVRAGLGVGLVNPLQLARGTFHELVWRPFAPRITLVTYAHVLASEKRSEPVEDLLRFLVEVGARLNAVEQVD